MSSHPVHAPMLAQHFQARPSRARSASVETGFIHERKHFIDSTYLNTHIHCYIPPSPRIHRCMVDPRSIAPPPLPLKVLSFLRGNGYVCELQVIIAIILLRSHIVIGTPTREQPGTYLGFAQGRGGGLWGHQGIPPPKPETLRIWVTIF